MKKIVCLFAVLVSINLIAAAQDSSFVRRVGWINTPGSAMAVAVSNGFAYVADSSGGLRVINVINPTAPVERGNCSGTVGVISDVVIEGTMAFVTYSITAVHGMRSIDVSDTLDPNPIGSCITPGSANRLAYWNHFVYVADGSDGLRYIDVNNPSSPSEFTSLTGIGDISDVRVRDDGYAFATDANPAGHLRIINADPGNPGEIGSYQTSGRAYSTDVQDTFAFVADSTMLFRLNISNLSTPFEDGSSTLQNMPRDIDVCGDYAFVAEGADGIRIYNSHAAMPSGDVARYNTPGIAKGVFYDGTYIYVADGYNGLVILELMRPAPPTLTAPVGGQLVSNSQPTFSWTPCPTPPVADTFLIQCAVDTLFTNLKFSALAYGSSILSPVSLADGRYYWRVRADFQYGGLVSDWSAIDSFRVHTTGPSVFNVRPYDGEPDCPLIDTIMVTFDEAVFPDSFDFNCPEYSGTWSPATWSTSSMTVKFYNNTPFTARTLHHPKVLKAYDMYGQPLQGGSYPWSFSTIAGDTTPPVIDAAWLNAAIIHADTALACSVKVTDNAWLLHSVTLHWKAAGSQNFTAYPMADNFGTGDYTVTVPHDRVAAGGVGFRVLAVDTAGNRAWYPADSTQFRPRQVAIDKISVNYPYDRWQMISIPADAGSRPLYDMLQPQLGTYDKAKWRLFYYGPGGYVEYGTGAFPNTLGHAFWLRHRLGLTSLAFTSLTSVPGQHDIGIHNGWNDVGNPNPFDVKWDDIYAATGADTAQLKGPYGFNPADSSWILPNQARAGNMIPWRGYSFKASNPATLRIPKQNAGGKSGGTFALWPAGWQAQVTVSADGGRDAQNYFGIGAGTSDGEDRWDFDEPPSFFSGSSGYFRIGQGLFATDLRPALGQGQAWDFWADCGTAPVTIEIALPDNFPAGASCQMADLTGQAVADIKQGSSYRYTPEPGEIRRAFKIAAGSPEFVKAALERAMAYPATVMMAQNRPNPFSGQTAIRYAIAKEGAARLAIYNVAGQRVKTLYQGLRKPGWYSAAWDGKDEIGRKVASGVYLYQLQSGETTIARRLAVLR